MLFKASAPGSLMLLGEYAVLNGKHALVCAVDKRITVKLIPRNDKTISITSALGNFTTTLSTLEIVSPFQFVLSVLKKFRPKMPSGCDIEITAEFSDKIGFASSAAVTVATLAALTTWLDLSFSKTEWIKTAREIVRSVQGLGSGADVAACVLGGIVFYRAQPFVIEKMSQHYPLTVMYSGSKTPTPQAVQQVQNNFLQQPALFKQICKTINECVLQGKLAIIEKNWSELGRIMNIQQGLMDALGVNTSQLFQLMTELRQDSNILGAKISGSGLGDCVIGLGESSINIQIRTQITDQGVWCEKN